MAKNANDFADLRTSDKGNCEGRRELFKGLKIDRADYDWKVHPVIHLNFGLCARGTPCVVLIDEYDDPVARALANPAEAELVRDELAGFYGKIKDRTHMIRFAKPVLWYNIGEGKRYVSIKEF